MVMAAGSPVAALGREEVALIFKRKKRLWSDGSRIQPVNLPPSNTIRRAFSSRIFSLLPEEMDEYWRDQYFHGELPPYVLGSEEAVVRFVAATPGAIGYVPRCLADRRVVVVLQLDVPVACPHQP
ncbi:hypothetical protein GRF61_18995 [Azoarcus sp. TTM-91]|nr:hypothetical protein [Azoarcus sp. TTM-91]